MTYLNGMYEYLHGNPSLMLCLQVHIYMNEKQADANLLVPYLAMSTVGEDEDCRFKNMKHMQSKHDDNGVLRARKAVVTLLYEAIVISWNIKDLSQHDRNETWISVISLTMQLYLHWNSWGLLYY